MSLTESNVNDVFLPLSPWFEVLRRAKDNNKRVSVLINGTFKPYTGYVTNLSKSLLTLDNEYADEYILLNDIKAVRVYV